MTDDHLADRIVPSAWAWPSNGHLIADVAQLYIAPDAVVLDPTYGRGAWWTQFRPAHLIAHDLVLDGVDFTALPEADASVDVVAFDPPYKLNGTSTPAVDARYGVDGPYVRWQDRHALIRAGIDEQARVLRSGGVLLLKCQDQVCSGQMRWQTDEFTAHAAAFGLVKVDRFDMLGTARPQPMAGRTQRHAHGRPSTLLVFRRVADGSGAATTTPAAETSTAGE
jgi:hypothetical protein